MNLCANQRGLNRMSKKKIIAITCIPVVGIIAISLAIKVVEYTNILNEPRLNLTKIQEHLDNGGSLNDPMTPDMYEKKQIK
jgi:hypothetical protein